MISVVLILSLFLLGVLALAVDFTNIWFHRQTAGAAADAACEAGAMDLLGKAGGLTLASAGFTPGTASNCVTSPSATICTYAAINGYNGGVNSESASNSVSWTFPASVAGVAAPPASQVTYPFLKVSIAENVATYFVSLLQASHYQTINVSCTCGVVQSKVAAPMVVLSPTASGAFSYAGGGHLNVVGGPRRSLQVNSSSSTAVKWIASGIINLSAGGPNFTGSDAAVVGGPATAPGSGGYNGGTTGVWRANVLPVADPYGGVPAPAKPANAPAPQWVQYGIDGCPDTRNSVYVSKSQPNESCMEFYPGYYPSGINIPSAMNSYSTAIFAPGIYYLNGSLTSGSSDTIRMAKPAGYQRTDGVMFYFLTGSLSFSGCTGCTNASIDNVSSTDLTCDGSTPATGLNMASTIPGNVLVGQCAQNGTYWDSAGDTTDSRGTPGSRGLLVFQAHADTTQAVFNGSGSLAFSGALYFHATNYTDVLSLSGGAANGTFILGEIVADQVSLTGSGVINLALNPLPSTSELKAAMLQ
jgi:hypothetical protein